MSRMSTFMATCGFCLLTGIAGGQTVLYVDANAPGPTHDGSSWCSAYTDLQDAFDAAAPWNEIHVADGTYTPDRGTGDRSASFELRSAIALYGGYPGCGMPEPQVRDPSAYETILSGDLTGNDAVVTNPQDLPGEPTRAENSYHVVVGSGIGASAILDGFTITAGNANGVDDRDKQGGGMRIYSLSNPTVTNCVFRGNSSDGGGGGMMNITNASPTVTGCTFTGNWAERGGGMANFSCANGVVTNCWFTRNAAEEGGAVMNNPSCSGGTTFINCAFSGNWAEIGGAVRNRFSGDPDFVNCVFSGNTGTVSGGGAFYSTDGSSPDLKNCIVWGNIPDQIFGAATVRYTCCSEEWFGIGNITDDPIFYDADGADDMFGTEDDDFRLMDGSPCIDLGANAYVTVDTDLAGFPRIVDGDGDGTPTVDMGAYELQDCNGNDIRDECDLDCGPPGGPCDVPGCGLSADCQPNGTPDECEPDCNANGTPDDCDIVASTSDDCNENGIPDKCEIDISSAAPGGPFYCDPADPPAGLDACDPDCNDDGRPDECGVIDNCLFDFRTFPAALNTNAASDSGHDHYPQLTTDGQGNWLAVWHSHEDLGGTIETDGDILFSISTDNGTTWSAPAPLNTNAASDSGNDWSPQLTTDGQGNWLAVWWSDDDLAGTIGGDIDILFSRSTDNGGSWTATAPLNSNAASDTGHDFSPQLTTDRQGNWLAVWHSGDDLGGTIGTDGDILFSRSTDNGASWTPPGPLNTNAASDSGDDSTPQLTTDGQGNWLAVWWSYDDLGGTIGTDPDILFSVSTDNGASWTPPMPLNTNAASDSGDDSTPQLTTDGQGNWLAVWESTGDLGGTIGTDPDILFSVSTDDGTSWTAPGPLNTNAACDSGDDGRPQLTTDGQGNWRAVWWSQDDLGGTIGTDADILFSASTDSGASWTAPAPLNTNAASDIGHDYRPQLTTDGQGNWRAVWWSDEDLGGAIGTDWDILFSQFRSIGEDCNCNGTADACDIAECAGDPACSDCNDNGIPDECDIADCTDDPACADCNGNGIPDGCDIAECAGDPACADCNYNGVPDECDSWDLAVYVDADSTGANDGTNWDDAFNRLQTALSCVDCLSGAVTEIRVAQGIYRPDEDEANPTGSGNRASTFQLISGVTITGGWAGYGEVDPDARDIVLYETVLSGDLAEDDIANLGEGIICYSSGAGSIYPGCEPFDLDADTDVDEFDLGISENSYHVVTASGSTASVLDGVTVTGGYANSVSPEVNGFGAGVYNDGGSPTLLNCAIRANFAQEDGGGMRNLNGADTTLTGCRFQHNRAVNGGGVVNRQSSGTLTDCVFVANVCVSLGAGMENYQSSPTLNGCTFAGNWSWDGGGGIFNDSGSSPVINHCYFSGNIAEAMGGAGMVNEGSSNPTLNHCYFAGHPHTPGTGSALLNSESSPSLDNCAFVGNGGNAISNYTADPVIQNSTFSTFNYQGNGGAIYNWYDGHPTLVNSILWIDALVDPASESTQIWDSPESATTIGYSCIQACDTLCGNPDDHNIADDPLFVDVVAGTWTAAGICDASGGLMIFTDDTATFDENGLVGKFLRPRSTDSLQLPIIANSATTITTWVDSVAVQSRNTWVAAEATYEIYDYHLNTEDSPCVNTGDPSTLAEGELDMDGEPRVMTCRVDMGIDEWFPDCNENGIMDDCDIDCDDHGGSCSVPECGNSPDVNANCIPDECIKTPSLPPAPHDARKNRYLSINPNNRESVALRVELVEMMRCTGDLRRTCSVDADCPNVCDNDADITCTGDPACMGGTCIATTPCIHHQDEGLTWWVQEPEQEPLGCRLPGGCTDEDWFVRLDGSLYFRTWDNFGVVDSSLLHISDCQITPVATYAVSACLPPTGDVCSDPLMMGTILRPPPGNYGDVVGPVDPVTTEFDPPNQILSVGDISGYLLTNLNYGLPGNPNPQAHWTWVDMEGQGAPFYRPQAILNVGDLNQILFGLMGRPYSWAGNNVDPGDCP